MKRWHNVVASVGDEQALRSRSQWPYGSIIVAYMGMYADGKYWTKHVDVAKRAQHYTDHRPLG